MAVCVVLCYMITESWWRWRHVFVHDRLIW
jgi:hypothetical protein